MGLEVHTAKVRVDNRYVALVVGVDKRSKLSFHRPGVTSIMTEMGLHIVRDQVIERDRDVHICGNVRLWNCCELRLHEKCRLHSCTRAVGVLHGGVRAGNVGCRGGGLPPHQEGRCEGKGKRCLRVPEGWHIWNRCAWRNMQVTAEVDRIIIPWWCRVGEMAESRERGGSFAGGGPHPGRQGGRR